MPPAYAAYAICFKFCYPRFSTIYRGSLLNLPSLTPQNKLSTLSKINIKQASDNVAFF